MTLMLLIAIWGLWTTAVLPAWAAVAATIVYALSLFCSLVKAYTQNN